MRLATTDGIAHPYRFYVVAFNVVAVNAIGDGVASATTPTFFAELGREQVTEARCIGLGQRRMRRALQHLAKRDEPNHCIAPRVERFGPSLVRLCFI